MRDWRLMDSSRPRGRRSKGWRDKIDAFLGSVTWKQNAQDRLSWKNNAEAFIQQVNRQWPNKMMIMITTLDTISSTRYELSESYTCVISVVIIEKAKLSLKQFDQVYTFILRSIPTKDPGLTKVSLV